EGSETAQMMHVYLPGVPAHGFGHAEDIVPARAEEVIPKPKVGRQFGVVPGETADVVPPHMPVVIVGVHDVAVVPESVPAMLLDLLFVMVNVEGKLSFQ